MRCNLLNRGLKCAGIVAMLLTPSKSFATCTSKVAVQVLGSGGPDATDVRASAGYVIWINGESRLLVDAGGGVFLRFGEARAKFESLDAIAITHLHADHVVDLLALLKSGFFSERKAPLPIVGPSGSDAFPSMTEFMNTEFDPKRGAFRYLSGYLDGSGGLVKTDVTDVAVKPAAPHVTLQNDRLKVTAIGVTHGPVPALAYLVEAGGHRIAFSGDQNGDNPQFADLIKGADVLIMDHAIAEMSGDVETALHARPSDIGKLAAAAGVKRVVLSHNMARSLTHLDENLAEIGKAYKGPVEVARDMTCVNF